MARSFISQGSPSAATTRVVSTDVAQNLPAAYLTCDAVDISCETNSIRYGMAGATPTQGATGIGHILQDGDFIRLTNNAQVRGFKFISKENGVHGALQISGENL